jgi:hypothetical protein
MALKLNVRDVAQANIDKFDQLGAFHGETDCTYHYPSGFGCAVGICDEEMLLNGRGSIASLNDKNKIETDDITTLTFIQRLHDYKTSTTYYAPYNSNFLTIPSSVRHLTSKINDPDDLTPELYKEIMQCIVDSKE